MWPDVELDLNLLDDLKKHASFKAGAGRTCVFSFGCNPGIASHFVRHGLRAVTGCTDMKAAAAAFGLRAIIFAERDTQWPVRGSKEEKLIEDTQTTVLYNTWSPGNYIVETVESTILYAGCPPEATKINAAGPAVTSWTPIGPILGFAAPHDECFTVQPWFEKEVPALFIYEAPATARNYVKGGKGEPSDKATCKLFTPATYNLVRLGAARRGRARARGAPQANAGARRRGAAPSTAAAPPLPPLLSPVVCRAARAPTCSAR